MKIIDKIDNMFTTILLIILAIVAICVIGLIGSVINHLEELPPRSIKTYHTIKPEWNCPSCHVEIRRR